jgi:hypothetical protein
VEEGGGAEGAQKGLSGGGSIHSRLVGVSQWVGWAKVARMARALSCPTNSRGEGGCGVAGLSSFSVLVSRHARSEVHGQPFELSVVSMCSVCVIVPRWRSRVQTLAEGQLAVLPTRQPVCRFALSQFLSHVLRLCHECSIANPWLKGGQPSPCGTTGHNRRVARPG